MLVEGGDVMEEYDRYEERYQRHMMEQYRREVEERMRAEMEEMYGQKLAQRVSALDDDDEDRGMDDEALKRLGVL